VDCLQHAFKKLPEIGSSAFALFYYLNTIVDSNGECQPGYTEMRNSTGLSNGCISNSLKALAHSGLIKIEKKFQGFSIFTILQNMNTNPPILQKMESTTSLIDDVVNSNPQRIGGLDEPEQPSLGPLSSAFVAATSIPELTGGAPRYIKAINDMKKAGITPEDITQAVQEMFAKGYKISGPWSVLNGAIMAMSERKNGNSCEEPDPSTYASEVY
jgi:hypothetical protein